MTPADRAAGSRGNLRLALVSGLVAPMMACLAAVSAVQAQARFEVAPGARHIGGRFPPLDSTAFNLKARIGAEGAGETEESSFGMVADVALAEHGSVFVADPTQRRILVFDSLGHYRRAIGRTGQGPGEFLAPFRVLVQDSILVVFDIRLSRVSIFDTGGDFRSSFRMPVVGVQGMAWGPRESLVFAVSRDSFRLHAFDLRGNRVTRLVRAPPGDGAVTGPFFPPPGEYCQWEGRGVYANPWIYEVVRYLDIEATRVEWVRREAGSTIRPGPPFVRGVEPEMPASALLGMECGGGLVVLAYFDRASEQLTYDFMRADGGAVGRYRSRRSDSWAFPGFLADLKNGRLAAWRSRPVPEVFVYQLRLPR